MHCTCARDRANVKETAGHGQRLMGIRGRGERGLQPDREGEEGIGRGSAKRRKLTGAVGRDGRTLVVFDTRASP
jgi:hypothetical protein